MAQNQVKRFRQEAEHQAHKAAAGCRPQAVTASDDLVPHGSLEESGACEKIRPHRAKNSVEAGAAYREEVEYQLDQAAGR
eukprot:CAMPEP_0115843210 /NCGR_PEP_ID=MMETSP0287-20121206/8196_1 /TAXON_ID=412157 /ORGANISM="Chrysochromulina rotalis, Strain UIO044" /LENGTH=79 /DNA_ID=CAMNT_0003296899 /DNA_START=697 /DNA_END=936 /DNA_ORIENTATION=+